ncbi:MAG: hypothetical protein CM1200mP30_32460 [Pseudomonadota bacterium]|nr:MAG: hypothetical protein CM1200mP30_32460 [Pseudomonadota bacterium]
MGFPFGGKSRKLTPYDICLSKGFGPGLFRTVKYMKTLHNALEGPHLLLGLDGFPKVTGHRLEIPERPQFGTGCSYSIISSEKSGRGPGYLFKAGWCLNLCRVKLRDQQRLKQDL